MEPGRPIGLPDSPCRQRLAADHRSARWRATTLIAILLLCITTNPSATYAQTEQNDQSKADPSSDESAFGVDALPSTADEVKAWLDSCEVKFVFADRSVRPRPFDGWTEYTLMVPYQFRTRYRERPDGSMKLTIRVTEWTLKRSITVVLPKRFESLGETFWDNPLVRHELDHVRIATHPRLTSLIDEVLNSFEPIELDATPSTERMQSLAREAIESRIRATVDAAYKINHKLDDHTAHGTNGDRASEWLVQVYSQQDLETVEYPFVDLVETLLRNPQYQSIPLPGTETAHDAPATTAQP
jgi:hypothetical protein